jgi:hypothetical protein
MFTKTPKLSEAQKTQIVIDYLVNEHAKHQTYDASSESAHSVEMMLRIQRAKLKILNKKFTKKK